ncbi:hypothetical protein GGX14DRAFT_568973 [Mycena pura]|uniref:Uncharacterized protein n=1 Tax=Mycena pura TaxID=153505 RepID=A0AAD6VEY0_9AGAR|nr:hypothetical protein GGX14DRAFT_568973 [Mycena pura]
MCTRLIAVDRGTLPAHQHPDVARAPHARWESHAPRGRTCSALRVEIAQVHILARHHPVVAAVNSFRPKTGITFALSPAEVDRPSSGRYRRSSGSRRHAREGLLWCGHAATAVTAAKVYHRHLTTVLLVDLVFWRGKAMVAHAHNVLEATSGAAHIHRGPLTGQSARLGGRWCMFFFVSDQGPSIPQSLGVSACRHTRPGLGPSAFPSMTVASADVGIMMMTDKLTVPVDVEVLLGDPRAASSPSCSSSSSVALHASSSLPPQIDILPNEISTGIYCVYPAV